MKATFNDQVLAESDATIVIENNHYFPPDEVRQEFLSPNGDSYECPWKGHADYYDVNVDGATAKGAAWMYPAPNPAAAEIAGYFAFWQDVSVTD